MWERYVEATSMRTKATVVEGTKSRCLKVMLFQATSNIRIIFHHLDIDHVGTQSSSTGGAMLTSPNKDIAVPGFRALFSLFW